MLAEPLAAVKPSAAAVEPVLMHYFRKAEILLSIVEGVAVTSLCGSTAPISSAGSGRGAETRTCAICAFLYAEIP